ncbi:hypothetical protein BD410DRAFT_701303, partial [Rickenella mellea]
ITFILQPEIPHVTIPFYDDIPLKGPATRYELPDGTFEVLAENPGVRRFVYEHLVDLNRVLHRVGHSGATINVYKLQICVTEVNIVGTICTYEGLSPDPKKIDKIITWPTPECSTEVRGFLGTAG